MFSFSRSVRIILVICLWLATIGGIFVFVYIYLPEKTAMRYTDTVSEAYTTASEVIDTEDDVQKDQTAHMDTPEAVRAIYVSSCAVSTPSFRNRLIKLVDDTELNALIIDIKDYTGTISFPTKNDVLRPAWEASKCGASNMKDIIANLHEKDMYVIGRITVFQDPFLASRRPDLAVHTASTQEVWTDNKGLHFTDVGAREVWEYHVMLSKEAYNIGFDEINFDYIRYPSDGPVSDIHFPHSDGENKQYELEAFFAYLDKELRKDKKITTSADIFGMTTTAWNDLNIGQILERTLPYFDYVAPMVYPSHYPDGFNEWANPDDYPYEVIRYTVGSAVERAVATSSRFDVQGTARIGTSTPPRYEKQAYDPDKIRPWLQDFDYGGDYDVDEVRAQIQATYDVGLDSWMLWSPSNNYTRDALKPAE